MENKVAKQLVYQNTIYDYSHAKNNVLVYITQPKHYYDDFEEDGGILIVKYNPGTNNNNYTVLHKIRISQGKL